MDQPRLSEIVTRPRREPNWLVPGVLHKGTVNVWAGEAGIGKSVLSYTLSVAKATGGQFLGRDVREGRVLYFDEENSQPDFEEYLRWAWNGQGRPDPLLLDKNLHMQRFQCAAHTPRHFEYMCSVADAVKPELIVLDTATPVCQIKDENDNGEANLAIGQIRRMQKIAGDDTTVLILKHAKLDYMDGRRSIRGAKIWLGACDAVVYHVAAQGRPRQNGLRVTLLDPDKTRAFGLKVQLRITPTWTGEEGERGMHLEAREELPE